LHSRRGFNCNRGRTAARRLHLRIYCKALIDKQKVTRDARSQTEERI
jgi:hypothetical protein